MFLNDGYAAAKMKHAKGGTDSLRVDTRHQSREFAQSLAAAKCGESFQRALSNFWVPLSETYTGSYESINILHRTHMRKYDLRAKIT